MHEEDEELDETLEGVENTDASDNGTTLASNEEE